MIWAMIKQIKKKNEMSFFSSRTNANLSVRWKILSLLYKFACFTSGYASHLYLNRFIWWRWNLLVSAGQSVIKWFINASVFPVSTNCILQKSMFKVRSWIYHTCPLSVFWCFKELVPTFSYCQINCNCVRLGLMILTLLRIR